MAASEPDHLLAGRYRLRAVIGRGGMGAVWRARDELLNRDVAIKEIIWPPQMDPAEREIARQRAVREAQLAARLRHPNVVGVYDIVEEDDRPSIVMELVPFRSLRDVLREDGPLSPARAARAGLGVLAALRVAHEAGIVHRDVKPANIMLGPDDRVVLTDFGIAKAYDSPTLTISGVLIGSPSYTAPERALGGRAGAAADLWALGASLYAAVEGRPPFERDGALASLTAVVEAEPDPPAHAGPLREAIDGLLRKDPATRLDIPAAEEILRRVAEQDGAETDTVEEAAADGTASPGDTISAGDAVAAEDASATGDVVVPVSPSAVPAGSKGTAPPVPAEPVASEAPDAPAEPVASEAPVGSAEPAEPVGSDMPVGSAEPVRPAAPAVKRATPWVRRQSSEGARRRFRGAAAVVAVLAVAVIAVGFFLATSRPFGTHNAPGAAPSAPRAASAPASRPAAPAPSSSAAKVATPSGSPAATPTSGGSSAVPTGYSRFVNSTGFSIAVPAGWQISHDGNYVYIRDPANSGIFLLIDQSDQPRPNALADWQQQAAARQSTYPGYHLILLQAVRYPQAEQAADWEFTYDRNGIAVEVLNRNVLANAHHAYALYWSTPVSDWNAYYHYFVTFAATFQPAGPNQA